PMGWRFPEMNQKVPTSVVSFSLRGENASFTTLIDVLKPAGFHENLQIVPSEVSKKVSAPVSSTPLTVHFENHTVSLRSVDNRITRAVVKLYKSNKLVSTL